MTSLTNLTYPLASADNDTFKLIAQNVMCAYPISDIYAPTPRFLYYVLLLLTFATLRHRWVSHMFLGAAVAYAASAAVHALIITARSPTVQNRAVVSIPFIPSNSTLTGNISALELDTSTLVIQPDAVELDIDPIMAIVGTAYLVGLPLQLWSRTITSSNITRFLLIFWNLCMLAATICALISWPTTNLAAPQYRFCYAGFRDLLSQNSDGWDTSYWRGTWNETIYRIYDISDNTVWNGMSNSCFYPCFNTSQTIRQSTSLKAVVADGTTTFAKLHAPGRGDNDGFRYRIYFALVVFTIAQFSMLIVSSLRLCSDTMRESIHNPRMLWKCRGRIRNQLRRDAHDGRVALRALMKQRSATTENISLDGPRTEPKPEEQPDQAASFRDLLVFPRMLIDILTLLNLIAGFCLFGPLVLVFVVWIEWYIRNDGSTNETIKQVGQWSPLVSVTVILFATVIFHLLKDRLSSAEEVRMEMDATEARLRRLKIRYEHLCET